MSEKTGRILFVIGSLREGGAEGQLLDLATRLHERGWDVKLMLLRNEGIRIEKARRAGISIVSANIPRFRPLLNPLPWLRLPFCWWKSARIVSKFQPDVVHAWLAWSHFWAWLVTSLDIDKLPVFITSRRQIASDSRIPGIPGRWLYGRAVLRSDHVIANVNAAARACVREFRRSNIGTRITVIHNGIDLDTADAAPAVDLRREFPALSDCSSIVIHVANLLPQKGHRDLLAAWQKVLERVPEAGLLCVGADGGILQALQKKAKSLGIANRVVFAGSRTDVFSLVKGADLGVHPSVDEGLPNSVLEQMACGRAVVATDAGGTVEAIVHGETGLVVPPERPDALADALLQLLTDPERCRAMGEAGRKRAEEHFPLQQMIDRHEALYRRLIDERRKGKRQLLAVSSP